MSLGVPLRGEALVRKLLWSIALVLWLFCLWRVALARLLLGWVTLVLWLLWLRSTTGKTVSYGLAGTAGVSIGVV
mgnify:CR=1 FL=1